MNPSVWELETFYRNRDIIIIGAGFTGLFILISAFSAESINLIKLKPSADSNSVVSSVFKL